MSKGMGLAIIEINDSGHCCGNGKSKSFTSPGYAFLTNKGVDTGDIAQQKSYLSPQQSFNQFWHQLNLSPLAHPTKKIRHNADLAFQQLVDLHEKLGSPSEILFAVPGSFNREQLSILLGLAGACNFQVAGLVDSAVSAISSFKSKNSYVGSKNFIHLDIQLHQIIFTRLLVGKYAIKRTFVDMVTDVGLNVFYSDWARYIANKFIEEFRYDPLHKAEGEQQLYDELPNWLEQLNTSKEIIISLNSPHRSYKLPLSLGELLIISKKNIGKLKKKFIGISNKDDILIGSHRLKLLPSIAEEFGEFHILNEDAVILGSLENLDCIKQDIQNIFLVTSIDNNKPNESRKSSLLLQNVPTHILYNDEAIKIGSILYIDFHTNFLKFSQKKTSKTSLIFVNDNLYFNDAENPRKKEIPLKIGQNIVIGSQSFQLIKVT